MPSISKRVLEERDFEIRSKTLGGFEMKKYPKRESIHPDWWNDFCECGHGWEYHELPFWKIFHSILENTTKSCGKCEKCMCPNYKREELQ